MHKNDPDLYVYAKRFFDEEVSKFSGGKSVKEFLIEVRVFRGLEVFFWKERVMGNREKFLKKVYLKGPRHIFLI